MPAQPANNPTHRGAVRLSETSEALEWLSQFREAELPIARRLLDDLGIVTPTDFTVQMRRLVLRAIEGYHETVALYPVWEVVRPRVRRDGTVLELGESIFPLDQPCDSELALTAEGGSGSGPADPNRPKPRLTIPDPRIPIAGSVGTFVQLIAAIQRERENSLDRPACHLLRTTRCHQVLLLDDVVGSGKRVTDYLEAFYRHPTIKSWFSYGKIAFTVVCYAATKRAVRRLAIYRPRKNHTRPHPVRVVYDQILFNGRSFWSVEERRSIEALCRKYAYRTSRPKWPLGFRDAFSMIVFPHGIPNTAPAILWAGKPGEWKPLFPERGVSTTLLQQFDQVQRDPAGERLEETLARVNQLRLAGQDWSRHATPTYRRLILLLGILARGFRNEGRIMEILELGPAKYQHLLADARNLALIATDLGLTPMGVRELEYARNMRVSPWEAGPLSEEFYVPQSLKVRVRQRSF